jgi:hypothetical protein
MRKKRKRDERKLTTINFSEPLWNQAQILNANMNLLRVVINSKIRINVKAKLPVLVGSFRL